MLYVQIVASTKLGRFASGGEVMHAHAKQICAWDIAVAENAIGTDGEDQVLKRTCESSE